MLPLFENIPNFFCELREQIGFSVVQESRRYKYTQNPAYGCIIAGKDISMKKRYLALTLALVCFLFTGCSGASMDESYAYNGMAEAPGEMYYDMADMDMVMEEAVVEMEAGFKNTTASTTGNASSAMDTGSNDLAARKLIRNASMDLETKEYDSFIESLQKLLATSGAYVQNGETTGSADRGTRWAYYTIRVPESRYDAFLSTVSDMANVLRRNEDVQDVTMDYTDMEARVRALETERDTLLAIMEKCTELDDVITVQNRITDVQYELDSITSRLNRYDDLIAYCTVRLSISEVEKETIPPAEKTLGQRIADALAYSCEDIVDDAQNFTVWFVSSLPYFGIWLVAAAVLLTLALVIGKRSRKKLAERQAKRALERAKAGADSVQNTPDEGPKE